jgi:predicted Zn-dependent peptidase
MLELRLPPAPPLVLPPVRRSQLANGLPVLVVERSRLPIVDVLLVLRSGAAADPLALAGRASLTAELIDTGTPTRSETDIARALDAIGARLESSANWDYSTIALQVLAAQLDTALDILADIVRRPTFPADEFRRGRDERVAAILQDLDDPDTLAGSAIVRAIYGAHHVYGTPPSGTRRTVEGMERDALVAYQRRHYHPGNAFLVMAGDVEEGAAVAAVDRVFGSWQAAAPPEGAVPAAMEPGATTIHIVNRAGAPQSELRIGTVGASRSSPDYFPLVVLNTVLGGSFTSRLNLRLREEGGYTYGAFSSFMFRAGRGPFIAGAAVHTDVTAQAIGESLTEMQDLREQPVPADELERARNYLTLGLPRSFETNGGIAARIAETEVYGLGDAYWPAWPERVRAVDAAAVERVAQQYLDPGRMTIAVVGDAAQVRAPLEDLGAGAVVDAPVPE